MRIIKIINMLVLILGVGACAVKMPTTQEISQQNQQIKTSTKADQPMLRLNTQMHTAPIRRMSIDAQQRFVVTGSHDKTARVWDLQTGDLLKVLRVPIGNDDEGKIYAVAISPDGETVAVGGWTKVGNNDIYFFNRQTGEIIKKITGLPNVILHLTYSPDGQFLVACLGGGEGIKIYQENQLIAEDKNYEKASYWADFNRQGRLVTSSYDGKVRLYDKQFQLIQAVNLKGGKQPFTVRFNPDGSKIAVGFNDSTQIQILSAKELSPLYEVDTQEISNGNLFSIVWSADGKTLLAGGTYGTSEGQPLFSWSKAGKGQRQQWVAAQNAIVDIQPLPNGKVVIAAADPLWGVFKPNGENILQQNHNIADFRGSEILLSNQGDAVQFGYDGNEKPAQFDLKARELKQPAQENNLNKPRTEALKITDWNDKTNPKLNGKLLELKTNEISRSLAIVSDNSKFVLGTEWYLRFFDQNGSEIWKKPVPSVTWAVNIAKNGKTVVAAFGDGTIRWYRLSDGVELLAFFPHNDGKRWVLWTPSGYYAASAGAEDLIGWHVNNGQDRAADFFEVGQFRDQFYRPDIIDLILEKLDENQAIETANANAGIKTRGAVELPPVARLLSPYDKSTFNSNKIKLQFQINLKTPDPITELITYWNERPHQSYKLEPREESRWTEELNVLVPPQDVTLKISIKDRNGRVSQPNHAQIKLQWAGTKEESKPRLNLLAIGIDEFSKEPAIQKLKYPSTDAQQFVQFFEKQSQHYRINTPILLKNEKKSEILKAFETLAKNSQELDMNIIFLAGHAENDPQTGEYHFLPNDFERKYFNSTAISSTQLKEYFEKRIKGSLLIFVDTCHAGNLGQRRRGKSDFTRTINEFHELGVVVFAAANALQSAIEDDAWGSGAFTKALMEALTGKENPDTKKSADTNGDGYIDFNEIESYVRTRVLSLTNEQQRPIILAPNGFSGDYRIAKTTNKLTPIGINREWITTIP